MSEIVKHLIDKNNNIIIPITKAANVETSDGGNVQAKFNQINEQITNLTNLDAKINAANRKIDEKSAEIGQRIDDEVDNILLSVVQINRDLDTVEQSVEDFDTAIGQTNTAVSNLSQNTTQQFAMITERVDELEDKVEPNMIEVTYAQLKTARNNDELIPGATYRITDYTTIINGIYDLSAIAGGTTYLPYAVSAWHPFDIIVEAVDTNALSEIAKATHHSGDTYFADSAVDAWELRYCLDNDTSRFMWADATNGKGVIYGLKDEFNNYCGYDFKNLMFPRYALSALDPDANDKALAYDANGQPNRYGSIYQVFSALQRYLMVGQYENPWENAGYDFAVSGNILGVIQFPAIDATYLSSFSADLYYTFDYFDGLAHSDYSLNTSGKMLCYENEIANIPDTLSVSAGLSNVPIGISGNVFENNTYNFINYDLYCAGNRLAAGTSLNTFGAECHGNEIGADCYGNTVGNSCSYNTVGNGCINNIIGDEFQYNTLSEDCINNTIGSTFLHNAIGAHCADNIIGAYCSGNSVGSKFCNNTIGGGFICNVIGNECGYNRVGDDCTYNTFGNIFKSNTVEYHCSHNMVGNGCEYNMVGAGCYANIVGNGFKSNTIGENIKDCFFGNKLVNVTLTGGSNVNQIKYYHLCDGISQQSITGTPNRTCETWVGLNSNGVLKEWCPADLAP